MFTKEERIQRLKELAQEYRIEEKGFETCQNNCDLQGELSQLREIHDIARAMALNIEALDKQSEEG